MDIQGKVFTVLKEYTEPNNPNNSPGCIFKEGDRVIALDDDIIPMCVLESNFNGEFDFMEYPFDKTDIMYYGGVINEDDMKLAEE